MRFRLILIPIFFLISSCVAISSAPKLPLPPDLVLRPVHMSDIKCATDDTIEHCQAFTVSRNTLRDMIYNIRQLRERNETLKAIIVSQRKR